MKGELRRKLCKEITGYAREGPFAQLLIRDNSQFHLGKSIFEPYTFDLQNIEERLAAEKIRSWMQRANVKKRSQKTVGDKHAKPSAKADQKKNTVTLSRKDYDLLCDFARRALNVIEYLSDPRGKLNDNESK